MKYYVDGQIKEDEMNRACSTNGRDENLKPERKKALGRHRPG
jgi:hypothetical protein